MLLEQWAGAATLRFRAADTIPGFASVVLGRKASASSLWIGQFVAGGGLKSFEHGSVELLLPGDRVVRATAEVRDSSVFHLVGESPWPEWALHPASRFEQTTRGGFLEIRCARQITADNWLRSEDLPLARGQRVLMDYRALEEILVPLDWFFDAGELLAVLETKVAAVIGGQVGLGLLQEGGKRPPQARPSQFRMFHDYDEARLWLMDN
jgi:hypothetical protein